VLHWLRHTPERARIRMWVAEDDDGRVVGLAFAELKWTRAEPGIGELWVGVLPPARGRRLGTALYEPAEAHLPAHGVRKVDSWVGDDPAGERFAERRGFRPVRLKRLSRLDVGRADLSGLAALQAEKERQGFRLAPLTELLDRRPELHALWREADEDMPREDKLGEVSLEGWERDVLANPLLEPEASMHVVPGRVPGRLLLAARRPGWVPGRTRVDRHAAGVPGPAKLAKLAAIRWCADHGVDTILTGNDTENAPMLAINDALGYEPTIGREVARRL
jgi:N-acetylglutamate synthase-like GNAT family acetyltransferase